MYRKTIYEDAEFQDFEDIKAAHKAIEDLSFSVLCQDETCINEGLPPMSEQYYLLSVEALNMATRYMKLADYHNMQGK